MEFGILGPLEVDGAPFAGGPKPRTLLAALLLDRGPVSDGRLIDALWAEQPPASADHALQVYVSQLRKEGIEIERIGGGYRVAPGKLDAHELERLLSEARAARRAGRNEDALGLVEEALGLWRGRPLAGLEDLEFAQLEIWRLDQLRLAALEEWAEASLALGQAAEIVPELAALVREHPLREGLCAALMLALYRSGRQAEALAAYAATRQALVDELGLEPGAELRALQGRILRQDWALQVEPEEVRLRRHLPAPATELVGRREEVEAVGSLLRGEARLVTLTGPGGSGKTRVAVRAAHELADAFADGVWFVGLAALVDPALVRSTIAETLGVEPEGLDAELRDAELLLVLDNFEQVVEGSEVVGELLRLAPRVRALATSRAPLRLYGEHELPVPPLPADDASELFLARARAAGRELRPGQLVAEICERLDRMPLAIELVAARAGQLTPDELVGSLDRRLELASDGPRDLPQRQRTLRAAIGWSNDLLGASEQRLLAQLGVFSGGFAREAVEAVCSEGSGSLATLVEGSLVRRSDEGRFRMLETIREYAIERLAASGEEDEVRRRHADYFLELAEDLGASLAGERVEEGFAGLEREHDNFRAALVYAGEAGLVQLRFRLASAVAHSWLVRGLLAEGRTWLVDTLAMKGDAEIPPLVLAQVLRKLATLEWRQGDFDPAEARAQEALALLEGEDEEDERYRLLILLGCVEYSRRNREGAREWWEQSAALARALENDAHLALALSNLGVVAAELQDFAGGVKIYEESVEAARRSGHREYLAGALLGLGDMKVRLGEFETGGADIVQAIAIFVSLGFRDRFASCCVWLAPAAEHSGDLELAARLLGAAAGIRRQVGSALDWQEQDYLDALVSRLRPALGDVAYDAAFATGEAAPDAVVQEVLSGSGSEG